jgi:hypothetical protein
MAQIPDWTALAGAVPTPIYRRVDVDESAAGVDEAIAGVGRTIQQTANDQWTQQQQLLDAKAQNAVEQHALAVQTAAEGLRQDIVSGKVPYDQAHDQLNQMVQNIPQPDFSNLRAPVATVLQGRIQQNIARAQFGMDSVVDAARKDDFRAQFGQGLDTLGKLAGMPGADIADINARADIYRPLGRNAGLPAATIDKVIQDFKDQNWFNQASQRGMEARDSLPALQQLQRDLTDENGFYAGKLDTEKRNVLLRSVMGASDALEARIDRAQEKVELHAQMALGRIDQQISSGVPATPEMWATWQDAVKGTSAEAEFNQRLQEEQTIQNVLRQPINQQQAYVQQRQQELMQQGGSVHDAMMVNRLATAVKSNTELMQSAPLLYDAQRNDAAVAPLDLTTLGTPDGNASIFKQINDRVTTLAAMREEYGTQIPMAPLLPQEVAQMSSQLQSATPAKQAQLLGALREAMDNDGAYMGAMRQIAPHSPVTAIAGSMLPHSPPSPGTPADSRPPWYDANFAPNSLDVVRILRGEQLLNPAAPGSATQAQEKGKGTGMPMPPDNGGEGANLRAEFNSRAGDMFRDRPQLGEAYYSVYKDVYAALAAEKGSMSETLDPTISKQAVQIALGNRVQFNGQTMSVPPGMDPSQFKGLVQNAVAGAARASNAPFDWADRMSGYGLREIGGLGSGRYQLTMGNQIISLPDGKTPFTIDLRKSYPPGPPAPPAEMDPMNKVQMSGAAEQFAAGHPNP